MGIAPAHQAKYFTHLAASEETGGPGVDLADRRST
jgi:hypothetical protein